MAKEQEFVKGFYPKERRDGAPDFVIGAGSFKVTDLIEFLETKKGEEWLNFNILKSKDGKTVYAVVDNWKPDSSKAKVAVTEDLVEAELPNNVVSPEDIPF